MLMRAKTLFDLFHKENVVYCHWKSNEHLIQGLNGETDLDILIAKESRDKATECLKESEYRKAIIQFGSIYPEVEEWIGYDENAGKLIHIHLHYEIVTGQKHQKEYSLPWAELMLSRRMLDEENSIYISDPALELIVFKCRIILKIPILKRLSLYLGRDMAFDKELKQELEYLFGKVALDDVRILVKEIFGEKSEALIPYFVKKESSYLEVYNYKSMLTNALKEYRRYGCVKTIIHAIRFKASFVFRRIGKMAGLMQPIYRKRLSRRGSIVAFIGADGCGKSTVTMNTEKWLNWKLEASRFYMGSGDHYNPLSKRLMTVLRKRKKNLVERQAKENQRTESGKIYVNKRKTGFIKYCAHIYDSFYQVSVAKHYYKELKKADMYRKKGGIALLDRYPQKQFEGINDGPKIAFQYGSIHQSIFFRIMAKREYKWFAEIESIRPDVVFKLYVSPEESIRRKPDHKYNEVAKKAKIVELLDFEESDIYTVNTEQNFNDEILSIRKIIWEKVLKCR